MADARTSAGGTVVALGVLQTGIHLGHGVRELTETFPTVVYGVVLPLVVSVLVTWGGYWITQRTWEDVSPWRLVDWCGAGLAIGLVLSTMLVLYQSAEGVSMADPLFVLAMFGTYGSAVGLLVGRYDATRQAEHARQEEKTRRLEEFASIVSHDLRNPLNVADGHVELLRSDREDEHLAAISRAHDRMEQLIEDLLTLAREGNRTMDPEVVSLADVARRSWEPLETDGATLRIEEDALVRADPARLRQLLENVLQNALDHGGAEVTVEVGPLEDGFYVADDGPGIPPDERETVFTRGFSTAPDGTGVGLAIVEVVATAHGWSVDIGESSDGGVRLEVAGVQFGRADQ